MARLARLVAPGVLHHVIGFKIKILVSVYRGVLRYAKMIHHRGKSLLPDRETPEE